MTGPLTCGIGLPWSAGWPRRHQDATPVGSAAAGMRYAACGVAPRSTLWLWSSESKAVKSAGVLGRAGVRGTGQPGPLKLMSVSGGLAGCVVGAAIVLSSDLK